MVKYYVVWEGRQPGIYGNWSDCKQQVEGFTGAKYKAYETEAEAQSAFVAGWKQSLVPLAAKPKSAGQSKSGSGNAALREIVLDSISVDVGCSGNPGIVEYKGVDTRTGELLFYFGPIEKGTNNLGEFLAIVHALAWLQKKGSNKTVYSDSRTAISWVRNKRVASNLPRDASTERIWTLVDRALAWLHTNPYTNPVLKWDTENWGEIKADFGRK